MTNRPMFPHAIDSTMLAALDSCGTKMFRTYMEHWKPQSESVHLVAGGAFAKGIEVARKVYFEGIEPTYISVDKPDGTKKWKEAEWVPHETGAGDREGAEAFGIQALLHAYGDFQCPPDSAKSLERTAGALEFYFANYPLGEDGLVPTRMANGKHAIEFSFALPLPFNHPVTGDPVLYTGRADVIGEFAGGLYVVDEKTTSSLGASWPRQWEMRGQFTGYAWAAREYGLDVTGCIVRGVSILKTKYDHMPAITYRAKWEINRWLDQVVDLLEGLQRQWQRGRYGISLGGACSEYGGCSMLQVCKSEDPEQWLPMYFTRRVWDPMARKEMTVEEFEASWGHNTPAITGE